MPGMFIDETDRVPITVDGEVDPSELTPQTDAIWIYPVMPAGIEQKVISRASQIKSARNGERPQRGKQRGRRQGQELEQTVDPGIYNLALLEVNVLAWQGPSFTDPRSGVLRPCTPEQIRKLNTKMPLIQKVLDEIGERNAPPEADEPEEQGPPPPGSAAEEGDGPNGWPAMLARATA